MIPAGPAITGDRDQLRPPTWRAGASRASRACPQVHNLAAASFTASLSRVQQDPASGNLRSDTKLGTPPSKEDGMSFTTEADLDARLRHWAAGSYPDEAAVELLIRSGWTTRAPLATHRAATLDGTHDVYIDWDVLGRILDGHLDSSILAASGGELRVLRIAHSLARGVLQETVPGLDRHNTDLVLAAIAHANGSHQHSEPSETPVNGRWVDRETGLRVSFNALQSLHRWPSTQ